MQIKNGGRDDGKVTLETSSPYWLPLRCQCHFHIMNFPISCSIEFDNQVKGLSVSAEVWWAWNPCSNINSPIL